MHNGTRNRIAGLLFLVTTSALGRLWLAAYCHDVFGSLPSERVLAEGGYETRGLYAGAAGFFAPSVQPEVSFTRAARLFTRHALPRTTP